MERETYMTRALLALVLLVLPSCAALTCDPDDIRRTTFAKPGERLPGCPEWAVAVRRNLGG